MTGTFGSFGEMSVANDTGNNDRLSSLVSEILLIWTNESWIGTTQSPPI